MSGGIKKLCLNTCGIIVISGTIYSAEFSIILNENIFLVYKTFFSIKKHGIIFLMSKLCKI